MAFKLKKVGSTVYPIQMANTMVICSENASLSLAYRELIENTLKIKVGEYFPHRNKGIIESLASNPNRDRAISISSIKESIKLGVDRIIVVTHIDNTQCKDRATQKKKLIHKIEQAQKAVKSLQGHFGSNGYQISFSSYIICIKGDEKVFHKIVTPEV